MTKEILKWLDHKITSVSRQRVSKSCPSHS